MKNSIIGIVLLTSLCAWAQPKQLENQNRGVANEKLASNTNHEFDEWLINASLGEAFLVNVINTNEDLIGGELEMNRHFNELLQVTMDREVVEVANFEN
jgi:hypothetical protein